MRPNRVIKVEVIEGRRLLESVYSDEIRHIKDYSASEILSNPQCSVCFSAKKLIEEGILVAGKDF